MDAFSEILSGVRLRGAVFFTAELSAPWGLVSSSRNPLVRMVAGSEPHLVIYHLAIEGRAVVRMEDGESVSVVPGDVVIFPHGSGHQLSSGHGVLNSPAGSEISAKVLARDLSPLKAGGGGAVTRFVCGYLSCDPLLCRPLLEGLPRVFTVNIRADRSGQWLESSFLHLVEEAASRAVGSEAMLARLSEALFVETLRRHIARLPEQETGVLAAARDTIVGRSLSLLHARVSHPWTIAELARDVGVSRSVLVERFTRYVADPPMTYLTKWRLQLAAGLLTTSSRGVAEVAAEVGYHSEAAFNRAFKRAFGHPPARYRRELRESTGP